MDKEKDSVQLLDEMQILLNVRKKLTVKSEIDGIIADTAEKFVDTLNAEIDYAVEKTFEPSASTKKSEMPCNCAEQTKTLQEIIDDAKAQLTDNQTYAAIVFRV